jgi:hypothetical protein
VKNRAQLLLLVDDIVVRILRVLLVLEDADGSVLDIAVLCSPRLPKRVEQTARHGAEIGKQMRLHQQGSFSVSLWHTFSVRQRRIGGLLFGVHRPWPRPRARDSPAPILI